MVKRKNDEPADKAAQRLKQLLDARRPVPEENEKDKKAAEKKADKPAPSEQEPPAPNEPKGA